MKKMTSLVGKGFQPAKCKTQLRLGSARIKLLRNKKGIQIAADRGEVADFLRNGQESNARLRVEHVIREQKLIEAYDVLFLYAERIAAQLPVIDSQKTCPPELKEDISTLLYASSRCAELPDFAQIRPMFIAKYGKEFVSAIEDLRPGCGVNGTVIEKLSVSRASGEAKLQVMKDIAAEHNVEWDPAPFEKELRAGPNDLLDGPSKIMGVEDLDDFPTVPSQKPILTQPDYFANSTSGRLTEEKVEPKNSPRPVDDFRTSSHGGRTGPPVDDFRTSSHGGRTGPPVDDFRTVSQGGRTGSPVDDFRTGSHGGRAGPPVDDFRTVSQGGRTGPPARKPPGRSPPRAEDPPFDTDMDPAARETMPRRSSRRESDSFTPLSRHQAEESRRNSIGVPREKSGRVNAAPVFGGIDESPPRNYTKPNRKGSIDEFDGSHRAERRQSQKYDGKQHTSDEDEHGGFAKSRLGVDAGRRNQEDDYSTVSGSGKARPRKQDPDLDDDYYKRVPSKEKARAPSREGSGKGRTHHEDQHAEDQDMRRAPSREGSGKGRTHYEDQHAEDQDLRRAPSREGFGKGRTHYEDQYAEDQDLRRAPSREGSGKGRTHYEDQYAGDHDLRRVPSREGSGKGRTHYEDQYAEEQNLRRASSKEGSGSKVPSSSGEEGRRSKEGSQYAGKYRRHDYSDEDADHIPEPPRRRDPTKSAPKYVEEDPEWNSELFKKSVTTRNPEDEYRDSPRGTRRDSLIMKAGVSPRESLNIKAGVSPRGDDNGRRPYADDTSVKRSNLAVRRKENERFTPQYDSSEPEDDPRGRGGGSRKPTNNFHTDRSSESGEEGSRQSRQRTPRLPSVDEQRKDSPRGSYMREDPAPRNSRFDNDETLTTSSRTEKRMSLPGEKPRASDAYDDTVRSSGRRATIGPEEIARGTRDSEDRRDKEKQSDRRQSAPFPKDDVMEGRQSSQRDRSDRRRLSDIPAAYEDDRPPRFLTPKVEDVHSPRRERPERPRKNISPRYDDDKPPPRFIKVGKQDDQDSLKPQRFANPEQQPTPRPRSNLQSHKMDPDLPKTPKVSGAEHRKSQSASDGQPPSKPAFMKPPDLDVLIQMFGTKGGKKK